MRAPREAILAATPGLAHPVVKAFAFEVAGGGRNRREEPIGAEIVDEVQAVFGCLAGARCVRAGVLATGGSEDAGPPDRDQYDGVEPAPARRLERGPALDEVLITKPLGPYLCVTLTVEEELSHLLLVEVSVVVQRCEDRHVARGQPRQQLRQLASPGRRSAAGSAWRSRMGRLSIGRDRLPPPRRWFEYEAAFASRDERCAEA